MAALVDVAAPLALIVVAAGYARRCSTLRRAGRGVPSWRQACFAAGVLLLVAADLPPLAPLADELVVAHMVQHLAIADLAALLVALGLTGPLLQPVLALRGLRWLRAFGNPLVALPLWALNLYLWHLSALYEGVLDSAPLHLLQHAAFFGFGLAMWMPLFGPLPRPAWFGNGAMAVYVVVVRLSGAVLGNVLAWSGSPLYDAYAAGEAEHGIAPLADQGAAGMVMMVESGLVTLGVLAWIVFRWARQDTERQRLLDLADERGLELDEARAGRAVAAGQGARLERRLRES
jgi:cytochrome c oxidase assembly factor CtaG